MTEVVLPPPFLLDPDAGPRRRRPGRRRQPDQPHRRAPPGSSDPVPAPTGPAGRGRRGVHGLRPRRGRVTGPDPGRRPGRRPVPDQALVDPGHPRRLPARAGGHVAELRRGQVPWSVSTPAAAAVVACTPAEAVRRVTPPSREDRRLAQGPRGRPRRARHRLSAVGRVVRPGAGRRTACTGDCERPASPYGVPTRSPVSTTPGCGSRSAPRTRATGCCGRWRPCPRVRLAGTRKPVGIRHSRATGMPPCEGADESDPSVTQLQPNEQGRRIPEEDTCRSRLLLPSPAQPSRSPPYRCSSSAPGSCSTACWRCSPSSSSAPTRVRSRCPRATPIHEWVHDARHLLGYPCH